MSDVYVCAQCGSPSVDYSELVGGAAKCNACEWSGTREGLAAVPMVQGVGRQETLTAMYNDFRRIFSSSAQGFIQFLVKWGYLEATQSASAVTVTDKKQAVRYINAIFLGAFKSLLELRAQCEKERIHD